MKLTKVTIKNFKSIEKMELDIKKHSGSYTTMLLGVNESGKSNILEALSYMRTPLGEFEYKDTHNKKDKKNTCVDLYFDLKFEKKTTYVDFIKKKIRTGAQLLNFELDNLSKNVYLEYNEKKFAAQYTYDVKLLSEWLFLKTETKFELLNGTHQNVVYYEILATNPDASLRELSEDVFTEVFGSSLEAAIKTHEPNVSFWKPSEDYLISSVDLNKFCADPNVNKPLKNIFALSEYSKKEEISKVIMWIKWDDSWRKSLMKDLVKNTNKYLNSKWKGHQIKFDIEIPEDQSSIKVFVQDDWDDNDTVFFKMTDRSEWFRQYISFLLSLSIENTTSVRTNELILIDEPEAHLHPSWIRALRDELLEIWKQNYLFVSTHSPFLIDKSTPERNVIIKKNKRAVTEKREIVDTNDIRDDEVLEEAFGISVYKDLLSPHRILVEWCSDKLILQKAFKVKWLDFGITNGAWSNVVTIASKLNQDDIKVLVLVDDDTQWKSYKEKILKIGGVYSCANVFTIGDLIKLSKVNWTIEDTLGDWFIGSKFKEFYKSKFPWSKSPTINFSNAEPFLETIKKFLNWEWKYSDTFMDWLKMYFSNEFDPKKNSFNMKFPLLNEIVDNIAQNLKRD